MASSGKKKTTMAKLARESKLRERRMEKQARKDARKHAAATEPQPDGTGEISAPPDPDAVAPVPAADASND